MSTVKIRQALETAVDNMPNIIPVANIVSSTAALFLTSAPHGLESGLSIKIAGHSILNGVYIVSVVSPTTFQIKDEITEQLITSVSNGTGGTVKACLTLWENMSLNPSPNVPFQEVYLKLAKPENPTFGDNFYRENGYLQINLNYPINQGNYDVSTRADLIRDTFKRGNSYTVSDVTVRIKDTPSIEPGPNMDSYIQVFVKIPFWADIFP